jgi:predicted protein tyrosine phosphatase
MTNITNAPSIIVCPLSKVEQMVATYAPERVVSLLDPDFGFPDFGPAYEGRHLQLHFHDAHEEGIGQLVPRPDQVEQLLGFLKSWRRSSPLLIHCRAGIGRSTAAAFIAACLHQPEADELTIALELRRVSPLARPNEVLIQIADAVMRRHGRMAAAIRETGRDLRWHGVGENMPFELRVI